MNRTHLTQEYADSLDGGVRWDADRLVGRVITRLFEYLWLHYPDASRLLIATDPVTGRTEPVEILSADRTGLWSASGSGWEPGAVNGPLQSLEPGDAADRHGKIISHDITLLGVLLPEGTEWSERSRFPGHGIKSGTPGADWEILAPSSTDRLMYLSEERLDREARARAAQPAPQPEPEAAPEPEPEEWAVVQLAKRTQNPLRRATVHKVSCRGVTSKSDTVRKRSLSNLWSVMARGYYADGPEPPTDLTTLYTLCSSCGADKALQEAKGDDLDAWKRGERLWQA